jgi:hypothetical protein
MDRDCQFRVPIERLWSGAAMSVANGEPSLGRVRGFKPGVFFARFQPAIIRWRKTWVCWAGA